ncbi:MAG: hypothetical protein ACRDJC_04245 [Thermomicrobiales bacterium]
MLKSRQLNGIWWRGGLVLILALLAHDLFMASLAHAMPVEQAATSPHEHDPTHQGGKISSSPPVGNPLPNHPSDCGTTGPAVSTVGNQFDGNDPEAPAIFPLGGLLAFAHTFPRGWSEPLWPPGTRRALIQVYRI